MKLSGEGIYGLNSLKEIEVTEEFLTLDTNITECQNEVSLINCKTKSYLDALSNDCGCLPFNIRITNEVK